MKIRFTSASLTRFGAPNAGLVYISDRDTPNLLLRVAPERTNEALSLKWRQLPEGLRFGVLFS